ncbi:MarR family protein [Pelotomaculum sp. FP]|nr:MarR family protein [Pelotomaculum sp. FP]
MGKLQRQLCLSPGTLTGLVDGLVEGQMVHRWRDNDDRRLVYLTLSEQGQEFLEDVMNYRVANSTTAFNTSWGSLKCLIGLNTGSKEYVQENRKEL